MDAPHLIQARLHWVQTYLRTAHAGRTCDHCGISRPTLRKWARRYKAQGLAGLQSLSRRPKRITGLKRTPEFEAQVMQLRTTRNLGPHRIQAELLRQHGLRPSTRTIWKVLRSRHAPPLRKPWRPRRPRRYSRPIPGERIQVDTCKVAPGVLQFTAVDDCTRFRVLGLYDKRTAANGKHFLVERILVERILKEFPFPVQRIQSDRGGEFFGYPFQRAMRDLHIKFRPIRPYSPHLNGKVERSQLTDKVEFYATVDLKAPDLGEQLQRWQHFYNHERAHGSLGGRTPMQRWQELAPKTPTPAQVWEAYCDADEPPREREWAYDRQIVFEHAVERSL